MPARGRRYDSSLGLRPLRQGGDRYNHEGLRGYDQEAGYRRPWTGGYREGYQGGTGGIAVNRSGGYGMQPGMYESDNPRDRNRGRGNDQGGVGRGYDDWYRRFQASNRPAFSPVGGMHPAMGGSYIERGGRRGAYDGGWYSQRTRWF